MLGRWMNLQMPNDVSHNCLNSMYYIVSRIESYIRGDHIAILSSLWSHIKQVLNPGHVNITHSRAQEFPERVALPHIPQYMKTLGFTQASDSTIVTTRLSAKGASMTNSRSADFGCGTIRDSFCVV